ncbi:MAG TPA: C-GCAxxG-C-C family protein [Dongiaceae bacterium]|nr:C-GCAxxG-C-C family protein [Dongiaceae bacterium]
MKHHALSSFHQPPFQYNCAQAVLHGYQTVTGDRVLSVADFKPFGGGRAPEGLCGALYAATRIAPHAAETLKAEFARRTGATTCRVLKGQLHHPCPACVSTAVELLETAIVAP